MTSIQRLATTLQGLASPEIKRKELIAAVRAKHPKATKKDVVRAAFHALANAVDGDVERAQRLQDFARNERTAEGSAPLPVERRRKDRRKDAERSRQSTH